MEILDSNISNAFFVVKETLSSVQLFGTSLISILNDNDYTCVNYNNLPLTDAAENNDFTTSFLWIFNRKKDYDDYIVMIDFNNVSKDISENLSVYSVRFKNRAQSWPAHEKWGQGKGFSNWHLKIFKPFCLINKLNKDELKNLLKLSKKEGKGNDLYEVLEDVFVRINPLYDFKNESNINYILDNFKEMQKEKKGFLK